MRARVAALAFIIGSAQVAGADPLNGICSYSAAPSIGGFTLTPREYFAYQGFAFVATTNALTVAAGNTANITVCNTFALGGKSLYVFKRRFDNNTAYNAGAMSYGGLTGAGNISDSTTYSSATAAATTTGNNLIAGGATSSGMTMTYSVGTARLAGTVNGAGYLPTNAEAYKLEEMRIIPPQKCFAQFGTNPAAALGGAAASVAYTLYWWEQ